MRVLQGHNVYISHIKFNSVLDIDSFCCQKVTNKVCVTGYTTGSTEKIV